jgi:hypothetical protein
MKRALVISAVLALLSNAALAGTQAPDLPAPVTSDQAMKADCLARIKKMGLKVPHPVVGTPPPQHCEEKNGIACGVPVGCEWMLIAKPKDKPLPSSH